jgi:hypothetical protein
MRLHDPENGTIARHCTGSEVRVRPEHRHTGAILDVRDNTHDTFGRHDDGTARDTAPGTDCQNH